MRSPNLSFFSAVRENPCSLKTRLRIDSGGDAYPTMLSNLPGLRKEAHEMMLQYLDYTMIRSIFRKYLLLQAVQQKLSLSQSFESNLLERL